MKFNKPSVLTCTLATVMGSAVFAGPALSQSEILFDMYAPPGEFILTDTSDVDVVQFNKERVIELCLGGSQHGTAMEVDYDDNGEAVIRPGNCMLIEAKEITVTPEGSLEPGWDLAGTVRTM